MNTLIRFVGLGCVVVLGIPAFASAPARNAPAVAAASARRSGWSGFADRVLRRKPPAVSISKTLAGESHSQPKQMEPQHFVDAAMREAYAGVVTADTYWGPPPQMYRLPTVERLQELKQVVGDKVVRAKALIHEQDATRSRIAAASPEAESALKTVDALVEQRKHVTETLADLRWDRADSRKVAADMERVARAYPDHAADIREQRIVDEDSKDLDKHEVLARTQLERVDRELQAARATPEFVRVSAAIDQATLTMKNELERLHQPEPDEPELTIRGLMRIQRGIDRLARLLGEKRSLLMQQVDPIRILAKKEQATLFTSVAREFRHLDLNIGEASAWLANPAGYSKRIDALVQLLESRQATHPNPTPSFDD